MNESKLLFCNLYENEISGVIDFTRDDKLLAPFGTDVYFYVLYCFINYVFLLTLAVEYGVGSTTSCHAGHMRKVTDSSYSEKKKKKKNVCLNIPCTLPP